MTRKYMTIEQIRQEAIKWLRFADTLNGTKNRYIIEREDRI